MSTSTSKIVANKYQVTKEEETLIKLINETYETATTQIYADPKTTTPTSSPDAKRTVNVTELSVRRLMTFFRANPDFLNLKESSQSILLKNSMMEVLLIHGVVVYNAITNTFHIPSTKAIYDAKSLEKLYGYEMYTRLTYITRSFHDLIEGDYTVIKIMLFIVLFNPNLEELSGVGGDDVQIISNLNMKYMKLLYSYMQHVYGWPNCEFKFSYFASLLREVVAAGLLFRESTLKN